MKGLVPYYRHRSFLWLNTSHMIYINILFKQSIKLSTSYFLSLICKGLLYGMLYLDFVWQKVRSCLSLPTPLDASHFERDFSVDIVYHPWCSSSHGMVLERIPCSVLRQIDPGKQCKTHSKLLLQTLNYSAMEKCLPMICYIGDHAYSEIFKWHWQFSVET
jgi:hypothetical protein